MKLQDYPEISSAIMADGAIRAFDGRYKDGFVETDDLWKCLDSGLLILETRNGTDFAILPKQRENKMSEELSVV